MDIENIRRLCESGSIRWTDHAIKRMIQRGIHRSDIKHVCDNGDIIERYPDDYPHPSCLISGITLGHRHLHIVCGISGGELWIISAYHPSPEKWTQEFSKRKG